MDGTRFDELTRLFGHSLSRRTALKASLGMLVSMARPGVVTEAQQTCPIFDDCAPDGSNRCIVLQDVDGSCMCAFRPMAKSDICTGDPVCTGDMDCPSGQYCATGWCSDGLGRCHRGCEGNGGEGKCPAGMSLCNSSCVDLTSDTFNCGACGFGCAGEPPPGYDGVGVCVDGACQLKCLEDADYCGEECTDFQWSTEHCGGCGNRCSTGSPCCGGRCVSRSDGERFCDFCGGQGGWPQGCLSSEMCDRGLCVASGGFELQLVVVTCPRPPQIFELPPVDGPADLVELFVTEGCQPEDGITVEARTESGTLVDTCITSSGVCTISGSYEDLPLELMQSGLAPGVEPDLRTVSSNSEALISGTQITPLINISGATQPETSTVNSSENLPPTGDLAYAVKNGDHWDIWVYSFETVQNIQLTSEPNSDQWAPAYSHDGSRLAYLSDQTDGSNQVWMMDPDGGNRRQLSTWTGAESIMYVAWSPDDSQLILTLESEFDRRLARMSAGGGEISDFIPASSAFATTSTGRTLLYVANNTGATKLTVTDYTDPFRDPVTYTDGDAPNLTFDGSYMAFQVGVPGGRHIEILKLGGGFLPGIPRVADDSNPVWLTQTHTFLAFVSSDGAQETIQINRLHDDFTTPVEIAPHDRVWYLSKRFAGEPSMPSPTQQPESVETLPTLEPLPDEPGTGTSSSSSELTGRVEFRALTCTGAETEFSVNGPGIALDYGPPCNPMAVPQRMNIQGDNGYRTVIMAPSTLDLQMGRYTVTHVVSGVTGSFDLVPTDAFIQSCSGNPDCLYQWFVTFITDTESDGAQAPPVGTGSLEVHLTDCPPGFAGPDYYATCHDNGIGQMEFILESEAVYEVASAVIEQSPGPGIARFWNLAPGTYGLDLRTKFVKAPAYVFCSPDQGETVLVDQVLADYHDPVLVPVNGQAVVCDWNMLN